MNSERDLKPDCKGCELFETLKRMHRLHDLLNKTYKTLGIGLVLFDHAGMAAYVNDQARQRLGLTDKSTDLIANELIKQYFFIEDQPKLNALVDALYECRISETVAMGRTASEQMTVVMLERLSESCDESCVAGVGMYLFDSNRNMNAVCSELARIFGLTKSEVRLAEALASGDTTRGYSEAHGLSINTVYSHLKSLLSKTGVNRQAELVRLILEYAQTLPGPDQPSRADLL
jgi:DNA-binding CsgD family transcriptional regulator